MNDNGIGFDSNVSVKGFGLKGINERVEKLGGSIETKRSSGSQFIISIPKV